MTHISTTTFADQYDSAGGYSIPFSLSVQAGDVLVAVMHAFRAGALSSIAISGWTKHAAWAGFASGDPNDTRGTVAVFSRVVSATGTLTGKLVGVNDANMAVTIYRGMKAPMISAETRMNNQRFRFPALAFANAKAGHLIHVGSAVHNSWYETSAPPSKLPSGATSRWDDTVSLYAPGSTYRYMAYSRLTYSERTFTSTTNLAAVDATDTARDDGWTMSLAIVDAVGPDAPYEVEPTGPAHALAYGFDFRWKSRQVQTAYAFRRRQGAGAWGWWDGDDFGAASETWITSSAQTVAVPAFLFPSAGEVFDLAVATKGDTSAPDPSPYSQVTLTAIDYPPAPGVTVSDVSAGVLTQPRPTITMTGSATPGATLTGQYHVLEQGGVDVWDSGIISGTGAYKLPVAAPLALEHGQPFTIKSRWVQDAMVTGWTTVTNLTAGWTLPATPTVFVSPTEDATSGLPGVEVSVTTAVTGSAEVLRNGQAWWSGDITGSFTLLDFNPPSRQEVEYAVRVLSPLDGLNIQSAWATSAPIEADMTEWLMDPLDPTTAVKVVIARDGYGARTHATRTKLATVLGSSRHRVASDVTLEPAGSFSLHALSRVDAERAYALLTSGSALSINTPDEADPRAQTTHPGAKVSFWVAGDVTEEHTVNAPYVYRTFAFDWVTA